MRLVMLVNRTDECTYSFTETYPIIADGSEHAICDFIDLLNEHKNNQPSHFKFHGLDFNASEYFDEFGNILELPVILTLDEWYN
jgi:hypothetical protein